MSCDMSCEEGTGPVRAGAGGVAMALRALESPDWPQLTRAVLGRNGTRRETVQRLAAMLDQRAGRDGREKPDGDADTGKRGLTERERRILDMWPRFEDGEPVMIGDEVGGLGGEITEVYITENEAAIWNSSANHMHLSPGERVKRPAPEVLDADGVEIKVGDTVWHHSGFAHGVVTSIDAGSLMGTVRYVNGGVEFRDAAKDLTHTRPDSWEQLESDAALSPADYIDKRGRRTDLYVYQEMPIDIVRRAKALAGVEVDG